MTLRQQGGILAQHRFPEQRFARREYLLAPRSDGDHATWRQPRPRAGQQARHVVHEEQSEYRDDGVERGHGELQALDGGAFERDVAIFRGRRFRSSPFEQRVGDVDAHHAPRRCHGFRRRQRRSPGAAAEIQHPRARSQLQPIHRRLSEVRPERQVVETIGRGGVRRGDVQVVTVHGEALLSWGRWCRSINRQRPPGPPGPRTPDTGYRTPDTGSPYPGS